MAGKQWLNHSIVVCIEWYNFLPHSFKKLCHSTREKVIANNDLFKIKRRKMAAGAAAATALRQFRGCKAHDVHVTLLPN